MPGVRRLLCSPASLSFIRRKLCGMQRDLLRRTSSCALLFLICTFCPGAFSADWSLTGNPELQQYFEHKVREIETNQSLLQYETLSQWQQDREELRSDLFSMLGLHPRPEKTPLNARKLGVVQHDEFRVEKLTFESMPGLYVTGNLYVPNEVTDRLPTILYVCGHARMRSPEGDISYGNKTGYQHHGAWFARNGYVCLMIDTLQLGEIEGIHHGTYRHDRWWWNSYGYTPAGVEAWNCIRALDYLETRDEVDSSRFGVTGRSGGGAYSWWISALDERIQCAVPVAGITTLRNHVVDGCVEGHCDCMFMVNTQQWDYSKVAALMAPRPLLISNSDKDSIFPLEGVVEIHRQVRHIYDLYDKGNQLGLQITEGPHKDTQELRIHAFRWFNRWLKNTDELIAMPAEKLFSPQQLRVFSELPGDEQNTSIDQSFVTLAEAPDSAMLKQLKSNPNWLKQTLTELQQLSCRTWPASGPTPPADAQPAQSVAVSRTLQQAGYSASRLSFFSEAHVPLTIDVWTTEDDSAVSELVVLNDEDWSAWQAVMQPEGDGAAVQHPRLQELIRDEKSFAVFATRGTGPHRWQGDAKKQIQIRRRFQLIGTTLDAMRIWDVRTAAALLQSKWPESKIAVSGQGREGWMALLSVAFGNGDRAIVHGLSEDVESLPILLNFRRELTPTELLAAIAANRTVTIVGGSDAIQHAAAAVAR